MSAQPTYAEQLQVVIGYMNHLGYVHCVTCAVGEPPERQPHPDWEPVRAYNLCSDDDECDGCHKPLLPAVSLRSRGESAMSAADHYYVETGTGFCGDCGATRSRPHLIGRSEAAAARAAAIISRTRGTPLSGGRSTPGRSHRSSGLFR